MESIPFESRWVVKNAADINTDVDNIVSEDEFSDESMTPPSSPTEVIHQLDYLTSPPSVFAPSSVTQLRKEPVAPKAELPATSSPLPPRIIPANNVAKPAASQQTQPVPMRTGLFSALGSW